MIFSIIGFVILGIIGFLVYARISEKKGLKEAPLKFEEAKKAFKDGKQLAALKLLSKAFFVPAIGYDFEFAQYTLKVLELLNTLLNTMNLDHKPLTDDLINTLKSIKKSDEELEIKERLTNPVTEFLEKVLDDTKLSQALISMVVANETSVIESSEDEDNYPSGSQYLINQAGKKLMSGNYAEAIDLYTRNLDTDNLVYKAFLFNQRGSCYLMNKDNIAAESDYKDSISLDPEKASFQYNYADFLNEIGRKEEALEIANNALQAKKMSKYDKKDITSLIKKIG